MLPKNVPKQMMKINLAEVQDETKEYERDQHHDQVQEILARRKRIENKEKNIPEKVIDQEQMPVYKADLQKKSPLLSKEWNVFDD